MAKAYWHPKELKTIRHELVRAGWIRRKDVMQLTRDQAHSMYKAMRCKQLNIERW